MKAKYDSPDLKPSLARWRKRWGVAGVGIIALAFLLLLRGVSPECWMIDLPFVMFTAGLGLAVFLLPLYAAYLAIIVRIFRHKELSEAAKRRWVLGLPGLLLLGVVVFLLNQARPSVAISWVTQGKQFKTIQAIHAANMSTMMSDRSIAWFEIGPAELRTLIVQHQLAPTNGINLPNLVSSDQIVGRTSIPERIPAFHQAVYYARYGSDEFQHPYRIIVLTNPGHDRAVWYSTYDR